MSATSPVIPLLGLLTLVVPLMGVLMALTPYLMPKRECFAVTVPDDAARDPYLRRLKRTYLAIMLALAAAVMFGHLWFHFAEAVLNRVKSYLTRQKSPPAWHTLPSETEDK